MSSPTSLTLDPEVASGLHLHIFGYELDDVHDGNRDLLFPGVGKNGTDALLARSHDDFCSGGLDLLDLRLS